MSQAEIAGGIVTPPNEYPLKGRTLRGFSLASTTGQEIRLSDYRGRSNLVLVFIDDKSRTSELVSELASRYASIREQEAEVLAVALTGRQKASGALKQIHFPYPLLVDTDGHLHREFGAVDAQRNACAAVYITDRFAEVFAAFRTRDGQSLPSIEQILNWIEFINYQCPECEPPEWPA